MVEITPSKKIEKGILKEFPIVKGILEEYDSEKIRELNKQFHEDKIQNLKSLIEAIMVEFGINMGQLNISYII